MNTKPIEVGDMVEIVIDEGLHVVGLGVGARTKVLRVVVDEDDEDDTYLVLDDVKSPGDDTWYVLRKNTRRLSNSRLFPVKYRPSNSPQ